MKERRWFVVVWVDEVGVFIGAVGAFGVIATAVGVGVAVIATTLATIAVIATLTKIILHGGRGDGFLAIGAGGEELWCASSAVASLKVATRDGD